VRTQSDAVKSGKDAGGRQTAAGKGTAMNLYFWLPAMFFLGLGLMGLCKLFLNFCEKI
jgi:hypothetical protein